MYCQFLHLCNSQPTHLFPCQSCETLGPLQALSKPAVFCHHSSLRVGPGRLCLCGVLWEGTIKVSAVTVVYFLFSSGHLHQGFKLPGLL